MKQEDTKTPRANQTRSKSERPKVWVPPSSLDAPPAPEGFRYRWIRAEVSRIFKIRKTSNWTIKRRL